MTASSSSVVVLQHRDHIAAGPLFDALASRSLHPETVRLDRDEPLPDPAAFRRAIILGSDEPARDPWFEREIEWLRRADSSGVSVLGIGTGAQALAVALGGGIEPARRPRRGWTSLSSALPEVISNGPWLAWDPNVVRLPPRAELLAFNSLGPQVFRVGGHLGVQFHPEITPEIIRDWVERSEETLDTQGIHEAMWRDFPAASLGAERLFSAFLEFGGRLRSLTT